MRILHFVPSLTSGGVANVWINLTKAFAELGQEVYLVGPVVDYLKGFVNLYRESRVPPTIVKDPLYAPIYVRLNKRIVVEVAKREKVDVILTHGPLAYICLELDVPCFSVVHGTYRNEVKWMRLHPIASPEKLRYMASIWLTYVHDMRLYGAVTKKGAVLLAVSRNTKSELELADVDPSRVFPVLNGVDKELFKPMSKDAARSHLEKKYGVELGGYVIVHVGLGPIKGTHTLVKALVMLKNMGVKFTALFAGRMEPSSYRGYVEDIIRRFNLNVKLLRWVPYEDLPYVYNSADVTVVPSYSEGSPLVIPESLACGAPVVATNVGGNPEYLSMTGLSSNLIDVHKYDFHVELAEKLRLLLYRSKRNSVDSSKVPSWSKVAKIYLGIFEKIVNV